MVTKQDMERKRERNRIFGMIVAAGVEPAEFEWVADNILRHRSTNDYYDFKHSLYSRPGARDRKCVTSDDITFLASPQGVQCSVVRSPAKPPIEFIDWIRALKAWLEEIQVYNATPDLWVSIGQDKTLSTAASAPNLGNTLFTAEEQKLISAKLDEIKGYVLASQSFHATQAEYIERQFDYLRESSERLGRKDWLNALIGGLVGQAINLALSPEIAKGLLILAATSFQTLWSVTERYLQ